MKMQSLKIILVFYLICIKINAGPATPQCIAICEFICVFSGLGYAACLALCLADCALTCFDGKALVIKIDQFVQTQVKIEDLSKNDFILSSTGPTKILKIEKFDQQTVFKQIYFNNNSVIEVTESHPIMINSTWFPVSSLRQLQEINGKTITKILTIVKNQRFSILTEAGSFTLQDLQFGAFPFTGMDYKNGQTNWKNWIKATR